MVATVVAVLVGWLAFSGNRAVKRSIGWFKAPTFHFELAPGNIPIPVLPWELPVARVVALPPYPSNRQIIGRMVEIVHTKTEPPPSCTRRPSSPIYEMRHRLEHLRHRIHGVGFLEDPQSLCQICHDRPR